MLSLIVCLFFSALKSGEIIDGIEHSGRVGVAHSHSVLSLASMDVDHDAHDADDADAHHDDGGGKSTDGNPSGTDVVHHHHHHDIGSDAVVLGGMVTGEPLSYALANRWFEHDFHAFGPSYGLKRPPRAITQHV